MCAILLHLLRALVPLILVFHLAASGKPEIFVPLGHTGSVKALAFSPDGAWAISGGMDNNLVLWDVVNGRQVRTFRGHTSYIKVVAFAPDGRRVVSGSHDGTTRVWDVATGLELHRFKEVWSSSLLFDGDTSVISGDMFGTIRRLDVASGVARELMHYDGQGETRGMKLLPSENALVIMRAAGFKVIHPVSGQEIRRFGTKLEGITDVIPVTFSADGRVAAVGLYNRIQLWDTVTGAALRTLAGRLDRVLGLAFTPDGRRLISGGENYRIKVWDLEKGEETRSIYWFALDRTGAYSGVNSLALSPDGKHVLAAYRGGCIKLWDLDRGALVVGTLGERSPAILAGLAEGDEIQAVEGRRVETFHEVLRAVEASPGKPLKIAYRRGGLLGEAILTPSVAKREGSAPPVGEAGLTAGGLCLHTLQSAKDSVSCASVSSDGHHAVTSHPRGRIALWDLSSGSLVRATRPHRTDSSVLFEPKGSRFLSAGDSKVTVWEVGSREPVRVFTQDNIGMFNRALAFTPDGRTAVSGGEGRLTLIDMERLKESRALLMEAHYVKTINTVSASRDGRYLASGDGRMKIRIWDLRSGINIRTMDAGSWVYALDFSPDGLTLVSGANRYVPMGEPVKTLLAWDAASGRLLGTFGGYTGGVRSVVFSDDGQRVLTAGEELVLWDVRSGERLLTLRGHEDDIASAGFMSGGRHVYSAGYDGTLRVWDLGRARETVQFIAFQDGEWVAITPEGFFNASSGGAKHLSVRMGNTVYGVDQFYARFYRPELVKLALAGKPLPRGESLPELLARKPAPAVRILSPLGGEVEQDAVPLSVLVTDQGGGIGQVRVYLNGTQVANEARGVAVVGAGPAKERRITFTVPLAAGPNEIRVVAFNMENSMESHPASVTIGSRALRRKPVLHALVVGINEYRNASIALTYAVPDARGFADVLAKAAAPLFETTKIRLMTTPEATTKEAIVAAFESLRSEARPEDLFIFYNASHGVVDTVDDEEQYFLLTSNVLLLSSRRLGMDALGQKDLARLLGNLAAQKKLVILDTCNAGKGGKELQIAMLQHTRGLTEATAVKLLQRAVGSAVFSASSDTQVALEGYKGHGLFTYVLLEGLRGKADLRKDGFITVMGLAEYLEEQVVLLSESVFKRQQTPIIQTGANFPIGRVR